MKKILALIFLSTIAFAESVFEFKTENETMVDVYFNIFNGIVALMSNSQYVEILKLIFLLGGFFVFAGGILKALQGGDSKSAVVDFTKYMIAGSMLMMAVLPSGHTARLSVTSGTVHTQYCASAPLTGASAFDVQVPWLFGWFAATVNQVGRSTTQLAATAFSRVDPLADAAVTTSMNEMSNGAFGGGFDGFKNLWSINFNKHLKDMSTTPIPIGTGQFDPRSMLTVYLPAFFNDCVFMYSSVDQSAGRSIIQTLDSTANMKLTLADMFAYDTLSIYPAASATDVGSFTPTIVRNFLAGQTRPSELLFITKDSFGVDYSGTCKEFFVNGIAPVLSSLTTDSLLCSNEIKNTVTPASVYLGTGSNASAPVAKELGVLAGLNSQWLNSKNSSKIAQDFGYAGGKSQMDFIITQNGTGYYMAKMLPYIQMGVRAILYAFFPFVFIVMMLPGGFQVMKSYFQSIIWVELWGPTAAILNMFLSYFQLDKIGGAFKEAGVRSDQLVGMISDADMLASVGGYFYASVPALTYLILKGSADMMGNITSGVASSMASNLDSDRMTKDISGVKKAQAFNKENGTNLSMGEALHTLELASAGAEGTKYGIVANRLGGGDLSKALNREAWGNAANVSKTAALGETYKDTIADKVYGVEARSDLQTKVSQFETSGMIKDGKIVQQNVDKYAESQGISAAAMSMMTNEKIDMIKKTTGLTEDKDIAAYIGKVDAASQVQDLNKRNAAFESLGIFKKDGSIDHKKLTEVSDLLGEDESKKIKKTARDFEIVQQQFGLTSARAAGEVMAKLDSAGTTGKYSEVVAQVKTAMGSGTTDKQAVENSAKILAAQGAVAGTGTAVKNKIDQDVQDKLYGIKYDEKGNFTGEINDRKLAGAVAGQAGQQIVDGKHKSFMQDEFSEKERVDYKNKLETLNIGSQKGLIGGMESALRDGAKELMNRGGKENLATATAFNKVAERLKKGETAALGEAASIIKKEETKSGLYTSMGKAADMKAHLDAELTQQQEATFKVAQTKASFDGGTAITKGIIDHGNIKDKFEIDVNGKKEKVSQSELMMMNVMTGAGAKSQDKDGNIIDMSNSEKLDIARQTSLIQLKDGESRYGAFEKVVKSRGIKTQEGKNVNLDSGTVTAGLAMQAEMKGGNDAFQSMTTSEKNNMVTGLYGSDVIEQMAKAGLTNDVSSYNKFNVQSLGSNNAAVFSTVNKLMIGADSLRSIAGIRASIGKLAGSNGLGKDDANALRNAASKDSKVYDSLKDVTPDFLKNIKRP